MTESPLVDSGFAVHVFSLGGDLNACLNKEMAFLMVVASSSNATSFGGNNASGLARVVKCYNCQGEGHMARHFTQPKRPRNAACDDISYAKSVLMANISNYGSDVISEVPHSETYLNDMENQSVHAMQDFE
ncbi:retrovirus-related pol polyprotein from transposon TNT 1-94 [Tanacetum coccineum]